MGTLRFLSLAVGLFFAVFFGMKWMLTVHPLKPDARIPTFHHVDADSAEYKFQQSSASDNDATRDRLRNDVLDYAKALGDDPCNQALRANYIRAAVAYARAWIAIVPCMANETCGNMSWERSGTDRAVKAFGTPLDNRVREAMAAVHKKARFGIGDFPKDTIPVLSMMTSDPLINPKSDPRYTRVYLEGSSAPDCGR
jgi:hypothetical protein